MFFCRLVLMKVDYAVPTVNSNIMQMLDSRIAAAPNSLITSGGANHGSVMDANMVHRRADTPLLVRNRIPGELVARSIHTRGWRMSPARGPL